MRVGDVMSFAWTAGLAAASTRDFAEPLFQLFAFEQSRPPITEIESASVSASWYVPLQT